MDVKAICVVLVAILLPIVSSVSFAENLAARGTQWVRSHDFTINGLVGRNDSNDPILYRDANMSSFMSWWLVEELIQTNDQSGLPWHVHIYPHPGGLSDDTKATSTYLHNTYANNAGWLVWDEPSRIVMNIVAQSVQWYKTQFPETLVYSNAFPSYASSTQLYGTTPPSGGYSYDQYLTDFVNIIQPDVLMYDAYPYNANGSTTNVFPLMNTIRQKALAAGIPYFGWIQSFQDSSRRTMSESDLRHAVFNHLAYGFKGVSYFTYDNQIGPGMVEPGNVPTSVYYSAQKLNTEVEKLGHTLKFLTSTEVRYVPGDYNGVPSGLSAWSPGAGSDQHILDIEVLGTGTGKDGLIGFFTDDAGQEYFMLVNEYHGASLTSAAASLTFELTFDQTVNEILRLNRETGMSEVISLNNHVLQYSLPGGTGDLFKYNTGDFVTDYEPPTAHYTFKETSPGTWEVLVNVSGEDTAGLSAYEIWVDGVDPALVSFTENNLGTGFASLIQGNAGGSFNAGNYQGISAAIEGIGMVAIDEAGVVLDVPALLGTLSTPTGLDEDNFRAMVVGLLNKTGDGFFDADGVIPTYEVIPFEFLLGDANGDGVVSAGDYASVQANFGNTGAAGGGLPGDANGDGVVSAGDYAAVQANFGNTVVASVPEPASIIGMTLAGFAIIRKRKFY